MGGSVLEVYIFSFALFISFLSPYSMILSILILTPALCITFYVRNINFKMNYTSKIGEIVFAIIIFIPALGQKQIITIAIDQLFWILIYFSINITVYHFLFGKFNEVGNEINYFRIRRFFFVAFLYFYISLNPHVYISLKENSYLIDLFPFVRSFVSQKGGFEAQFLQFYLVLYGGIYTLYIVLFPAEFLLIHRESFNRGGRRRLIRRFPECKGLNRFFDRELNSRDKLWSLTFMIILFFVGLFGLQCWRGRISITDNKMSQNLIEFVYRDELLSSAYLSAVLYIFFCAYYFVVDVDGV